MILHMTECTERERELFTDCVSSCLDRLAKKADELRERADAPNRTDAERDSMKRGVTKILNLWDEYAALLKLCPGLRKTVTLAKHGRFPPPGEID